MQQIRRSRPAHYHVLFFSPVFQQHIFLVFIRTLARPLQPSDMKLARRFSFTTFLFPYRTNIYRAIHGFSLFRNNFLGAILEIYQARFSILASTHWKISSNLKYSSAAMFFCSSKSIPPFSHSFS
jgi:hypothetical protein